MDKIFKSQFWFPPPPTFRVVFLLVTIPKCWKCFFSTLRGMCIFNDNKYCQELRDFSTLKHLSFYIAASYSVLWVQFSRSVVSDSLWHLELQCARPPCPSATPGVYSNSCPLSRWCHPAISSSVVPFSSRLQSFPAQGLFHWVSSSHQVAKVLEFQFQHQSFQWVFRTRFL